VLQAFIDKPYLLAILIFLGLLLVPAFFVSGQRLRNPGRPDRRKMPRGGADRRA